MWRKNRYVQLTLIQICFMMSVFKGKTDFPQSRMIMQLFSGEKSYNISPKKAKKYMFSKVYQNTANSVLQGSHVKCETIFILIILYHCPFCNKVSIFTTHMVYR